MADDLFDKRFDSPAVQYSNETTHILRMCDSSLRSGEFGRCEMSIYVCYIHMKASF